MNFRHHVALCVFALLPLTGYTAELPDAPSRITAMDTVQCRDGVEGLWEMTAGGAVLSLRRMPGKRRAYSVTLVDSPDFTLEPGITLGTMTATAIEGKYDMELCSDPRRGAARKSRRFVVEISDSAMRMSAYRTGKTLRLYRLLPYLFRLGIADSYNRPEGIDGATRIAPGTLRKPVAL